MIDRKAYVTYKLMKGIGSRLNVKHKVGSNGESEMVSHSYLVLLVLPRTLLIQ